MFCEFFCRAWVLLWIWSLLLMTGNKWVLLVVGTGTCDAFSIADSVSNIVAA